MKGLLLRVGIDKGRSSGGCLAPIFSGGAFEYIPILEGCVSVEARTYTDIAARGGGRLSDFVPAAIRDAHPHFDPEFDTFTYGDPTPNKRRQLLQLDPGDLLVFYAGLDPSDRLDVSRLFIIGYFTVKQVHSFERTDLSQVQQARERLGNNAHLKRRALDSALVIVEGDPQRSRLLSRALPLGDPASIALKDLSPATGYEGSLLRAIGHWVNDEHVGRTGEYLSTGVPALVDRESELFSYVLASDTGFSPNVTGGYCTLACCKPEIRRTARVGDWVMGTLPQRCGRERLGYLMRVSETLSFDQYSVDSRFQRKKPPADPHGDNIYSTVDGRFVQLENYHHGSREMGHDTRVNRLLVSSLFWYFGENSPGLPTELWPTLKRGRGHRRITDHQVVKGVVSWVSSQCRPGVLGRPRDCDKAAAGRPLTTNVLTIPEKHKSQRACSHPDKPTWRRDL